MNHRLIVMGQRKKIAHRRVLPSVESDALVE
jgi:hypothetical protein